MIGGRWLATAAAAVVLAGCAGAARAQSPSPAVPVAVKPAIPVPVIVVVDPQAVVQHSKAGQTIRQQHDKFLQSFETELQATRKELTTDEAQINQEKATTPFADWQKKAQAFDQRLAQFNQKYGRINQAVERSYITAMNDLGKAVTQITSEVASDVGANLVLPTQQVVLHDPRMDLTKLVVERMDSKYPVIAFPAPDVAGGEISGQGPGGK